MLRSIALTAASLALALTLVPSPALAHEFRVLVYTEAVGIPHDSIAAGVNAIEEIAATHGFLVDTASDSTPFSDAGLAPYDVVIWLSTTGDVLDDTEQAAFERYIQAGGGYVGIHAAADTERDWEWYGGLLGAYADVVAPGVTGPTGTANVLVSDRQHASSAPLPLDWVRDDEWYDFVSNPRGSVHVLATVDEDTYSGGGMGFDHPVAWCQLYDGGRSWYSAGGHASEVFDDAQFREHLLGGILWAADDAPGECGATVWANYQKVQLDGTTSNPMEMDIAPDGRVFFIERSGAIKIWKPDIEQTVIAGNIAVNTGSEGGFLGIALDPDFSQNGHVFFFFSEPQSHSCGPTNAGVATCGDNVLARFTLNNEVLDPGSRIDLLRIELQREQSAHNAGALEFGPNGDLYLSTGDDTEPFQSGGFNPIDERPGRAPFDAQRTSANTNDLRGKVLRIHPEPDGSYTIPPGNLFAPGTPLTLPEIYVMGLRNAFRVDIDPATGLLVIGENGPDAPEDVPGRGPSGRVEWNLVTQAVNLGWPYCIGNNEPYNDFDFATNTPGPAFDCDSPVNDSPNNTGLTNLPASQPAVVWYGIAASDEFPEVNTAEGVGSSSPGGGPVFHHDPGLVSDVQFPAYYDNVPFFFEWGRSMLFELRLDGSGAYHKLNRLFPVHDFSSPIDIEFGPDGALYILEWGAGFDPSVDPTQELVRVEYRPGEMGQRPPVAIATATPDSGQAPLAVDFNGDGSFDPDDDPIDYAWDFESDSVTDSTVANPSFLYPANGVYNARLTVTDSTARSAVANLPISVGNTRPTVSIQWPPNGGFFEFGDYLSYTLDVQDPEDGAIDCSEVVMQPEFGHATHAHPLLQQTGCGGFFQAQTDGGHGFDAKFFYVVTGNYDDHGANGVPSLTGRALHVLQPKRKQAEYYDDQSGVVVRPSNEPDGHLHHVSEIEDGDWIAFDPINLHEIDSVTYRWSAFGAGGRIEVRVDAPDGPLISNTGDILPTGDDQVYKDVTAPITDPGGTHKLYFVFRGAPLLPRLFNINWIDFNGAGVTELDVDGDGVVNDGDNCLFAANPGQEDNGGIDTSTPDGIGDACQCGDVTGNGIVNGQDGNVIRLHGQGREPNPNFVVPGNCDVTGNGKCNGQDTNAIRRAALGIEPNPNFGQNCHNAIGAPVPPGL